jgi:hypothetical protein
MFDLRRGFWYCFRMTENTLVKICPLFKSQLIADLEITHSDGLLTRPQTDDLTAAIIGGTPFLVARVDAEYRTLMHGDIEFPFDVEETNLVPA